jgi:hypothetical protein
VERHHNSTGNRQGVIAHLELLIEESKKSPSAFEQQVCTAGGNRTVEYTYGWYLASVGNNDMQGIISKVKL